MLLKSLRRAALPRRLSSRRWFRPLLRCLAAALTGAALSGAAVMELPVPLLPAYLCALTFGPEAVAAYLGAAAGYLLLWETADVLEPLAAGLLILSGLGLFRDLLPDEQRWFRSAAGSALYALVSLRDGAAALRAVERLGQIAAKLFKRIVQRSEIILRAHAPRRILYRDGDGLRRAVDLVGDDVTGVGQLRLRQAEQRRDGPQNGRKPRRGRDRPRGQGKKRQDHDGQSQDDNQDVFENFEDLSGHCGSLPFVSCLPKGPLYEEGGAAAAHGAGDQWSPLRSPPELRSNS